MSTTPKTPLALTDEQIVERIATEILGWRLPAPSRDMYWLPNGNHWPASCWNPLIDWNQTWQVIEAMKKRKCCILLEWQKVVDWNVAILPNHVMAGLLAKNDGKVPEEAYTHEGDNGLQKTICLAALSTLDSQPSQ